VHKENESVLSGVCSCRRRWRQLLANSAAGDSGSYNTRAEKNREEK